MTIKDAKIILSKNFRLKTDIQGNFIDYGFHENGEFHSGWIYITKKELEYLAKAKLRKNKRTKIKVEKLHFTDEQLKRARKQAEKSFKKLVKLG